MKDAVLDAFETPSSDAIRIECSWLTFAVPVMVGLAVSSIYISAARAVWFDDPYIFFEYIRNLAGGQGLSFNQGELSFGATSILWPLLMAVPTRLTQLDAMAVAQVCSIIMYALSAGVLALTIQRLIGNQWIAMIVSSMYVAYPSAAKIGMSGMEIGLFLLLMSLVLLLASNQHVASWPIGILSGLLFLTRPDAVVMLPVMLIWLFYRCVIDEKNIRAFVKHSVIFGICFGIVIAPWLLYLHSETGNFLPSTQAGKMLLWMPVMYHINYAQFQAMGLVERFRIGFGSILEFFTDYRQVILTFGVGSIACIAMKRYLPIVRGAAVIAFVYTIAQPLLFSFTFPIFTFRYFTGLMLSAMLTLALVLEWGCRTFLKPRPNAQMLQRFAGVGFGLLVIVAYAGLHYLSFGNYLEQVEQQRVRVDTAEWLDKNLPPDATIATEPLGALGYYSHRYIVDMGGLITLKAQTLMPNGCSNPAQLGAFLQSTHPTYFADCSGLCLGEPALENAKIQYEPVYSVKSDEARVVACSIYKLTYPLSVSETAGG